MATPKRTRPRKSARPRPLRTATPGLNTRQAAFVRHYVAGVDGVRGDLTQAYIAAGYSARGHVAEAASARLLRHVGVQAAIAAAHAAADRVAVRRLRDWKELAAEAQERLVTLARGEIPEPAAGDRGRVIMGDRDDAAVAKVIADVNREIIERAEPKKLMIGLDDPAGVLATLLGVRPEAMPPEEGE